MTLMKWWVACVVLALAAPTARAADSPWLTSLPDALRQAKADHKAVLMDFTGSDWCPACITLHKEILTKPEFLDYARTNLVLVEVDFPVKIKQPESLSQANDDLQKKYNVTGYPTLILINASGKKIWSHIGDDVGGPNGLITSINKARR